MLIFLAVALLLLLPSPWNVVAFLVLLPLWVLELFAWNRTTKRHKKAVGAQTLIGREAVVSEPCRPVGQVRLDGEIWEARCEAGASTGDRVRITGRERLTLIVEPVAS
jgi:membrane-bound serine protease (ClpP class)